MENTILKKDNNNQQQRKNKPKQHFKNHFQDQLTESDTPKKNSLKLKIIQWLKQLPLDQRYLAVKVYAPGLSRKIQETLIKFENDHIQQIKKDISTNKKITPKQSKQIIESIVLISDGQQYFDSIGFDFSYIQHPDKLYDLLTLNLSNSEKQMFQSDQYEIQEVQLKDSLALVQNVQTKQQLASIIISFLRADIFIKFQQKKPINLQDQRNRKKQFSMFWRNLSQQNKRKILLLHKQNIKALSTYLEDKDIFIEQQSLQKQIQQMIQLDKNQFCNKIFKCKLKRSLTYYTDYHELIYKAWKNQLNKKKKRQRNHQQRANNQKNNNLQKPSTSINGKSQAQQNQKPGRKPPKIVQKQKQGNSQKISTTQTLGTNKDKNLNSNLSKSSKKISISGQSGPSNTVNCINIDNQLSTNNFNTNNQNNKRKRNRNYNNRRKKSVSAQSKQTKATSYKVGQQQVQKIQEQNRTQIQQPRSYSNEQAQKPFTQQTLIGKVMSPISNKQINPETLNYDGKNLSLEQNEIIIPEVSLSDLDKIQIPPIDYELQIKKKLLNDISQYSDLINQEANQFYERRIIAYERIQFILSLWNIPIKLFGSCASGITIKNSDIDIAVDNSILNYFGPLSEGQRLKTALQYLQLVFQQQPCVTSLKLIKTAAIPLIKMKIDTSVQFIGIPGYQIYPSYIQNLNRQHISSGEIHVDLTIQTINKQLQCNHLGIISTDQINRWLKQIKPLHSIVIIIKNYLTKMNLNITYEGGLNTYSMICMIVAFIKHAKYQNQTDTVMVLQKMLRFFIYQFDEKLTGIDLTNQNQIFYNKLSLKTTKSDKAPEQSSPKLPQLSPSKSVNFCQADLQIKDPLNNGKIMTKNCYSFPKIKQVLKEIYEKCFIEIKKQLQINFIQKYKQRFNQINKKINGIDIERTKKPQAQKGKRGSTYSRKQSQGKNSQKLQERASQMVDKRKKKVIDIKSEQKIETVDNNNLVNQLIEQCKRQLSNPFLTLFQ